MLFSLQVTVVLGKPKTLTRQMKMYTLFTTYYVYLGTEFHGRRIPAILNG